VAQYEALRTAALTGTPHPAGLSAVAYHGLLLGLSMLATGPRATGAESVSGPPMPSPVSRSVWGDPGFLHVLANMVLLAHAEVAHVY
jgi:hypothetical protein